MRLGCELFLWPPVAPPAGDGFFYPNLEQRGEVVVDVTLKKAEVLLEAGSFQAGATDKYVMYVAGDCVGM